MLRLVSTVRRVQSYSPVSIVTVNSNLDSRIVQSTSQRNIVPHRMLYSESTLRLDIVNSIRESKAQLYQGQKDRYIERLAGYIKSDNSQSILKDDLTNLIGLAENEEHLDLIEKIAVNLKDKNDLSMMGWGTSVMRLYYTMKQIDRAYNNIKDTETYGKFFDEYTAFRIAITMLYQAGRYQDVIEIYKLSLNRLKPRQDDESGVLPGLAVVAFASLAKINTPEALMQAAKLYEECDVKRNFYYVIRQKAVAFVAYLAVNHDEPAKALNLISDSQMQNYVTLRELKTISLLKLKRYEDVLYHLRETVTNAKPDKQPRMILRRTCEMIEQSLDEIEDQAIRQNLMDLLGELKKSNQVDDNNLESLIFLELKTGFVFMSNDGRRMQQPNNQQYQRGGSRTQQNGQYNRRNFDGDDDFHRQPKGSYNQGQQRGFNNNRRNAESKTYFDDYMDEPGLAGPSTEQGNASGRRFR